MILIDNDKCIQCGQCAKNCADHALGTDKDGYYHYLNPECYRCGQCVAICPVGAITMTDMEDPVSYTPDRFDIESAVLLNAMRFRRSIRSFTGEKASAEQLKMLLDAGRCAPTSCNCQAVQFTVLDQEFDSMRPKIWDGFAQWVRSTGQTRLLRKYDAYRANPDQPDTLFYGATQMIAVTSPELIDGCLALANMELMAHTLGLATVYCGFAANSIQADASLREYFGVTDQQKICGCLLIGKTNLKFHRTAPRNPAQVQWK